ncbi:putative secreted protein [Herbaspirillum sp. SJZ107]|nr:putative secreted protein [Herbaspirillum sp. SJZ107]
MGWKKSLGAALLSMACVQAWATTLSVTPTPAVTTQGSTISVAVNLSDVIDLSTYQFSLSYDQRMLHFTGYTAGGFLSSGGAMTDEFYSFETPNSISFVTGIAFGGASVSGSGTLAYFTFDTVAAGYSGLTLSDVLLLNTNGGDIATTIGNSAVTVQVPTGDVPEPASWMLIGAGLVAAGALRRRRVSASAAMA